MAQGVGDSLELRSVLNLFIYIYVIRIYIYTVLYQIYPVVFQEHQQTTSMKRIWYVFLRHCGMFEGHWKALVSFLRNHEESNQQALGFEGRPCEAKKKNIYIYTYTPL